MKDLATESRDNCMKTTSVDSSRHIPSNEVNLNTSFADPTSADGAEVLDDTLFDLDSITNDEAEQAFKELF